MPKLTIVDTGEKVEAKSGTSLVDLFEFDGIRSIPFNCMRGVCGSCAAKPIGSPIHLGEQSNDEKYKLEDLGLCPDNHRLLCQCKLMNDTQIELV
ncbi:2Fe-2S iron-sulfur cluster-binding protein [Aliivibrio fischeri]|uniref:2Fe-2S iron-sulfur cluster-binding protein n=1 Tax=Aliivibrio fischeri TaxID=668 RepID=UPI0009C09969|nr:2Fe-2S iron-sulfur cluster-binding protein [Aliivibrio fischeri]